MIDGRFQIVLAMRRAMLTSFQPSEVETKGWTVVETAMFSVVYGPT